VQGQPGRPGAAIEPPGQSCRQATGPHLTWSRPWSNGLCGVFVCAVPSPAPDNMLRRLPISKVGSRAPLLMSSFALFAGIVLATMPASDRLTLYHSAPSCAGYTHTHTHTHTPHTHPSPLFSLTGRPSPTVTRAMPSAICIS
jgi:hypothetical protein